MKSKRTFLAKNNERVNKGDKVPDCYTKTEIEQLQKIGLIHPNETKPAKPKITKKRNKK